MKKLFLLLAFIFALSVNAVCQSNPPLTIREVDGSPKKTNATELRLPNGTLSISGGVVTYTPAATGAPANATYITQTPNGSLSAEQALSALSTGLLRVATTTGVLTSLTDSAGIAANIGDETGTGVMVFGTSPTIVTPTIASFANANHNHTNSAGGGTLAEAALALTDITTNDASASKHGFLPKLSGNAAEYLKGDGTWGAGGGTTINPTDGVIPYRSNSTTFADSPLYRVSSTMIGIGGTSSSFPGLTNNGARLDFKKADNSGYAEVMVNAVYQDGNAWAFGASAFFQKQNFIIGWSGGATWSGTNVAGLTSTASGVVEINDGNTSGTFRDLKLRNLTYAVAGTISITSGTNQRAGNATLVGGTVTVSNTTTTSNTVVMLTRKTSGGTIGTAITYTVNAGVSFTISSDNILDTSTFSYFLIEVP